MRTTSTSARAGGWGGEGRESDKRPPHPHASHMPSPDPRPHLEVFAGGEKLTEEKQEQICLCVPLMHLWQSRGRVGLGIVRGESSVEVGEGGLRVGVLVLRQTRLRYRQVGLS